MQATSAITSAPYRQENNNYSFRGKLVGITGAVQVPELVDIERYCKEIGTTVDPLKFYQYYSVRNWKRNGETIKDWKEVVRSWAATQFSKSAPSGQKSKQQMAIYGEDPEFTAYVNWFSSSGGEEMLRKIRGENGK